MLEICHFLPQGISLTQGSNPNLLCLLNWQADSLPPCGLRSPATKGSYCYQHHHICICRTHSFNLPNNFFLVVDSMLIFLIHFFPHLMLVAVNQVASSLARKQMLDPHKLKSQPPYKYCILGTENVQTRTIIRQALKNLSIFSLTPFLDNSYISILGLMSYLVLFNTFICICKRIGF